MIYIKLYVLHIVLYLGETLKGANYLHQWLFLKQEPCVEINNGWEQNV